MRIGDAFFQNKKISVLPSESRLLLFFAPLKVEKKVTPLLPLPPGHEENREDAVWRQMRRAVKENGFMPWVHRFWQTAREIWIGFGGRRRNESRATMQGFFALCSFFALAG